MLVNHVHVGILLNNFHNFSHSLRGTCKHVASLCHNVIEMVNRGENKTVTEQRQVWHAPSKKVNQPDFLENIHIQKIQGKHSYLLCMPFIAGDVC